MNDFAHGSEHRYLRDRQIGQGPAVGFAGNSIRDAEGRCYVRRYGRISGVFNAAMNQADRKNAA